MHYLGRVVVAFVAFTAGGCIKLDSFSCAQSSECQSGDLLGTCEPAGLCSFPDPMCPSGKKYGELAGDQSGQCVGDSGGSSGGTTPPTTSPTTSVSATGSSTFDPATDPGSDTTFDPTTGLTGTSDVTTLTTTDPSTTTTASTDPVTTDPETTNGPTCGNVGEACVNGACCGPCAACQDNICQPGDLNFAKLNCGGACSTCTADGQCGMQPPETACTASCSDLVWQEQADGLKVTCLAYGALEFGSVCDGSGQCTPPLVENCPDPTPMPETAVTLASCDSVCLKDSGLCLPGSPASAVTSASYCAVNVEVPGCQSACTVDKLNVIPATCNDVGTCTYGGMKSCAPYLCNPEAKACRTKCSLDSECASGKCQGTKCM
jgi:hypothetical protein